MIRAYNFILVLYLSIFLLIHYLFAIQQLSSVFLVGLSLLLVFPLRRLDTLLALAIASSPLVLALEVSGIRSYWLVAVAPILVGGIYGLLVLARKVVLPRPEQAQLAAFWNTVVDGLVVIDERGTIISVNPATERIFGYGSEELVGCNVKKLMPAHYAGEHDGYLSAYNQTADAKIIGIGREVSGRKKNGEEFPLYLAVNKFEVDGKRRYGGILRDLTADHLSRKELIAAKEVAESASLSKSVFLGSMSHEVRTPLNAIVGFTQLLEMGLVRGDTPERRSEYLGHISRSADHLLGLLNSILDFARMEAGQQMLRKDSLSVQGVMDDCRSMVEPIAADYGVTLKQENKLSDSVTVCADLVGLRQSLVNLLTNAIKYNHRGGSVVLSAVALEAGCIRFRVTDTGAGIPADKFDKMFEPFNRLGREGMAPEGTGIGLSIAKTAVERMGGKLGFESTVGIGSSFWIDLPESEEIFAADTNDAKDRAEAVAANNPKPEQTKISARVLYVEDNPDNVILMQRFFRDVLEMPLLTVVSAEEGLELVSGSQVDLILMDLSLPGMDGFEAQAKLAADKVTKGIPVVAVSADANPRTIQRAMNTGFRKFITKPFDLAETKVAIESLLQDADALKSRGKLH